MLTMIWLGIKGTRRNWIISLVMAVILSISLLLFLILQGFITDQKNRYDWTTRHFSVIQETGTLGELHGSRLSLSLQKILDENGISPAVGVIRTVIGTSPADALMLRGMDPKYFPTIEDYHILSGRSFEPEEPPRRALIGVRLAQERGITIGHPIQIRGREFQVIGIFENGTIADFEAWVSLQDAQNLLGWTDEVSIWIVPTDRAKVLEGKIPPGTSIVPRGESGRNVLAEWEPLLDFLSRIALFLGISTAIALANSLMRLVLMSQREISILQTIGFDRRMVSIFIATQGGLIVLSGSFLAFLEVKLIGMWFTLKTAGIAFKVITDDQTFFIAVVFSMVIFAISIILPVFWLSKLNISRILKTEV